jgi:hypothetical protein
VEYDFKLKLATVDALLDYHPFGSSFRLSGGVIHNGNSIDVNARPNANGSYTINGRNYSAASVGQMKGDVEFRKVAPYLGIGWGNAVQTTGWGFGMDLGVAFQGARPGSAASGRRCRATISPIDSRRSAPAGSPSIIIPNTAVPTVPMPVQTA